jgi:hypothetical protein
MTAQEGHDAEDGLGPEKREMAGGPVEQELPPPFQSPGNTACFWAMGSLQLIQLESSACPFRKDVFGVTQPYGLEKGPQGQQGRKRPGVNVIHLFSFVSGCRKAA